MSAWDLFVFDFDGTICDSAGIKTEAFSKLYLHEGPEIAARVYEHHLANMGVSRFDKIRYAEEVLLGRECTEEVMAEIADKFGSIVRAEMAEVAFIDGVVPFLDEWHDATVMTVASATPTAELRGIVEMRNLGGYFAAVEGSPRAKSEIVAGFLEMFGARPDRTMFFGDQNSDLRAAADNRTCFIGVRQVGEERLFPPSIPVVQSFSEANEALAVAAPMASA